MNFDRSKKWYEFRKMILILLKRYFNLWIWFSWAENKADSTLKPSWTETVKKFSGSKFTCSKFTCSQIHLMLSRWCRKFFSGRILIFPLLCRSSNLLWLKKVPVEAKSIHKYQISLQKEQKKGNSVVVLMDCSLPKYLLDLKCFAPDWTGRFVLWLYRSNNSINTYSEHCLCETVWH